MSYPLQTKPAGQGALYNVNFAARLATGVEIASVVSVEADQPDGAEALDISGETFSGAYAQFFIGIGGTPDELYTIEVTVTDEEGNTLVGCVRLRIRC